jgi:hypothetical protein
MSYLPPKTDFENTPPHKDPVLVRLVQGLKFIPTAGPQTDAYFSDADVMLYGGAAGGGKSALMCGLALQEHERSLIIRRQYSDMGGLTDDLVKFYGSREGFVSSPRPRLRTKDGRKIEFGALQNEGDEFNFQGSPKDLICFDEASQLKYSQVKFVMGWLRSTKKGQRCRVIFGTNPPTSTDGEWLIDMFAPWLDPKHPNPAKHGELRWYITNESGRDEEVDSGEIVVRNGKNYIPLSRTFIPARLDDNPYLRDTGYRATLDAMPEPYRSAMRDGNFMLSRQDADCQIIPSEWVRAAQKRWLDVKGQPPPNVPMCAMGVDCSGGGKDYTTIVGRYDGFFTEVKKIAGSETPNSQGIAARVFGERIDDPYIVIDMGGGYGGEPYTLLRGMVGKDKVVAYKGATDTTVRSKDKLYTFTNTRTAALWKLREALDPNQIGGSKIMLPDSRTLFADLTTPTFEITTKGIKATPKKEVIKKLNRSTDEGDCVMMAWFIGERNLASSAAWGGINGGRNNNGNNGKVVVQYANRKTRMNRGTK